MEYPTTTIATVLNVMHTDDIYKKCLSLQSLSTGLLMSIIGKRNYELERINARANWDDEETPTRNSSKLESLLAANRDAPVGMVNKLSAEELAKGVFNALILIGDELQLATDYSKACIDPAQAADKMLSMENSAKIGPAAALQVLIDQGVVSKSEVADANVQNALRSRNTLKTNMPEIVGDVESYITGCDGIMDFSLLHEEVQLKVSTAIHKYLMNQKRYAVQAAQRNNQNAAGNVVMFAKAADEVMKFINKMERESEAFGEAAETAEIAA